MITHLEPDILVCEVKWALGSTTTNKASGGDGIPFFHEILQARILEWVAMPSSMGSSRPRNQT